MGKIVPFSNRVPLLPELITAYENAVYVVFADPDVTLRVGAPSPALDALLGRHGVHTAAFVTAANPRGVQRSHAENAAAMATLEAGLAWPFHRGEGRDPEGRWPAEASVLIAGIGRAEAEALGRRLAQNAILFAEKGGPVELVLLEKMRLVLDTQVWIDWLVFDDPATQPLRAAVADKRAEIFINASCRAELERVLGYPLGKRVVDAAACLEQCLGLTTELHATAAEKLPECRDPDDQKFLELAAAARADCLITRDRALLEMNRRKLPFRILAPGAFARR
jgi:putative PIN family toxin of toxin-antitoxin system